MATHSSILALRIPGTEEPSGLPSMGSHRVRHNWSDLATAAAAACPAFKRLLLLGRKVMTNLDSILKSRDITLSTKVHLVRVMVFPVLMYGYESWTIKKAEHRRIDAFELWCWKRFLRVPWTARRSNQSWVFIGRTDVETETPILWPADEKSWLIWKDPDAGKYWGQEEKGRTEDEMVGWHHRLSGWVWVNPGSWWWTGRPGVLQFMGSQRVGHNWATELNWTDALLLW